MEQRRLFFFLPDKIKGCNVPCKVHPGFIPGKTGVFCCCSSGNLNQPESQTLYHTSWESNI